MQQRRRSVFLACIIALAAACGDATGPCDTAPACSVEGADLAVVDVRLLGGDQTGTDPVTKLPIYRPARVRFEFTVVNRGDTVSVANPILIFREGQHHVPVPPLRPGEVFRDTASMVFTDEIQWMDYQGFDARMADARSVVITLLQGSDPALPEHDADATNNTGSSSFFHLAVPVLTLNAGIQGTSSELRPDTPFYPTLDLQNYSLHGGDLSDVTFVLCMVSSTQACTESAGWVVFGHVRIAGLEAGTSFSYREPVTFPMEATPFYLTASWYGLNWCMVPGDYDGLRLPPTGWTCSDWSLGNVLVRPNFPSCSPRLVQPGTPETFTERNCAEIPDRPASGDLVFAFDAVAGQTYRVTGAAVDAYDADGERPDLDDAPYTFRFSSSGRYYFAPTDPLPLTITIEAVPET